MQQCLLKGYQQEAINTNKKSFFFLKSSSQNQQIEESKAEIKVKIPLEEKLTTSEKTLINKSTNTDEFVQTEKLNAKEINLFRVLAVNYLVHLIVFSYAGWMGK